MRKSLLILFLISFILISNDSICQKKDSLTDVNTEFITEQLENISRSTDLAIDFSDLVDEYLKYYKNPIQINSNERNKLLELNLLNEFQLAEVDSYILEYGGIMTKNELFAVSGLDKATIERISPFITYEEVNKVKDKFSVKNIFKYGRHQLIARYSQIIEKSNAYTYPKDTAIHMPSKVYLGTPQKYYCRYSFNYMDKIRAGLSWEKDAGELLFRNYVNDSIKKLLASKISAINDFSSLFIYVADIGVLKKAIIGDYHLEFGQGLTMWSGLSFGKSSAATQVKKYGRGLVPNTSVNENRFMRGAAVNLGFKKIGFTAFYSKNNIDANLLVNANQFDNVSGLLETGNHRTINEILDKDVLNISMMGANININTKYMGVGITATQSRLSIPIKLSNEVYKKHYFQGDDLYNFGVDFSMNIKRLRLFGEVSATHNADMAFIIGLNAFLSDRFTLSVNYRDYSLGYFSFYNNPFGESSVSRNEKAIYLGFSLLLAEHLSLSSYADFYKFPWLKYRMNSPGSGLEYLLQLNYQAHGDFNVYIRYKYDANSINSNDIIDYLDVLQQFDKHSFRLNLSYKVFDFLYFKNRIEVLKLIKANNTENGYLIYQDILYRPTNQPISLSFRYALFSTSSWDSRIYAYENDVLYAFSIPAYYDKGQSFYLLLKYDLGKKISFWFRIKRVIFDNKTSIGSGNDEIIGNHKTEVKVQLKLKL